MIGRAARVAVPKIPATRSTTARGYDVGTGTTDINFAQDRDAEAEGFELVVVNESIFSSRSKAKSDPHVIEDDEVQDIVLERDGTAVIYEGGPAVKFDVTASPARVDLPLDIRFDLEDVTDETVASRDNNLDKANGTVPVGDGPDDKETVTLTLDKNDGNRVNNMLELHVEVVSYAIDSGAYDDVDPQMEEITVYDVHKLPPLMVAPAEGTVMEGGSIMLTLTIDRNPPNTIAIPGETRQYTSEPVTVMLTANDMSTAGMDDYTLPMMATFEKHDGKAPWMQSMMVEVMATMDDDIDEDHMLVVNAKVDGTVAANGDNTVDDMSYGVSTLTIMDETAVLVWANPMNVVEKLIYDAKAAGMGDDMMFTMGGDVRGRREPSVHLRHGHGGSDHRVRRVFGRRHGGRGIYFGQHGDGHGDVGRNGPCHGHGDGDLAVGCEDRRAD